MRIALAQIMSGTDPRENLKLVEQYTYAAAQAGSKLVVFPEGTMCRFGVPLTPVAEPLDGPWADEVRSIAARYGITVLAGMFTPAADGRVTNTMLATGPDVDARYDKIHMYDAFGFKESDAIAPGAEPVVIKVDGVGVGVTLCYDIRFPALYTELADRGASVITVSASWGAGPGKLDQWTLLSKARALDSSCFIAAVGQAYPGDELSSSTNAPTGIGGSTISSPLGEVVGWALAEPKLIIADLDIDRVTKARETVGVLRNRAPFTQIDKGAQLDRAESPG